VTPRVKAEWQGEAERVVTPATTADARAHRAALSGIERENVRWLWPGRVPLGMLTLLIGDPGLGKSLKALLMASWTSRAGADVLILSAEDHAGATIRPRAEAVKADLDRLHIVTMRREGLDDGLALPDDAAELDRMVEETRARLVIVDPLMAHLPEAVNSWRDQSVRRALAPLHRIAEQRGCAAVVIAHLNKARGADPLYRAGGSIGIPAAVRSALLLARDPEDPDGERGSERVLAHVKCNVAEQAESLACRIEPVQLPGDKQLVAPRLVITGTSMTTAEDLLDRPNGEERTERDAAVEFLEAELAEEPQRVKAVKAAANEAGVSWRTVERAKATLGVKAQRVGGAAGAGHWEWELPSKDRQGKDRHPHISDVAVLAETALESQAQDRDGSKTATDSDMAPLEEVLDLRQLRDGEGS
jgi:putative DNA primase/helicase